MVAISSPQLQETPHSGNIDRFLVRLPSLWQQGEVRPTHTARVRPPRQWRTGRTHLKACGATCCCGCRKTPTPTPRICWHGFGQPIRGAFSDAQLRTLQRRVKDWRGVIAKRLVYAASDEPAVEQRYRGDSALVGTGISG